MARAAATIRRGNVCGMDVTRSSYSPELDALRQAACVEDENAFLTALVQRPELLSEATQRRLARELRELPDSEREPLARPHAVARRLRRELEAAPERYPLGAGPIERICDQELAGEIGSATARELARGQHLAATSRAYVRALARRAQWWLWGGDRRRAAVLHDNLIAALDARRGRAERDVEGRGVLLDRILTAHRTLLDIGDPGALRDGIAAGTRLVQWARAHADSHVLGEALHRLGSLHSDPWIAHRTANRQMEDAWWRMRGRDSHGLTWAEEVAAELPDERSALETAVSYLRDAAKIRTGGERAETLMALALTLRAQEQGGGDVDGDEILASAREALGHLDIERYPQQGLGLMLLLRSYGDHVDLEPLDQVLQKSLDHWVERIGAERTAELVNQAVDLLKDHNPDRALSLSRSARGLVATLSQEHHRVRQIHQELDLLERVFAPADNGPMFSTVVETVEAAQRRWQAERWDPQTISAFLLAQAARAAHSGEESLGLHLLEEVERIGRVFAAENREALLGLRTFLLLNHGTTTVQAGHWADAVPPYAKAMRRFLDLGMRDHAFDCLHRIADIARNGGSQAAENAIGAIAMVALELETAYGEPAAVRLQAAYRNVFSALVESESPSVNLMGLTMQLAKGLGFAAALYAAGSVGRLYDEEGARLLDQIKTLEDKLPPESWALGRREHDPFLLTTYASGPQARGGDKPEERLINLRVRYDTHLNHRLLSSVGTQAPPVVSMSDVRWALGERTVLLNLLLGRTTEGTLTAYMLALAGGDDQAIIYAAWQPESDDLYAVSDSESTFVTSAFAPRVQNLLQQLRAPPDPDLVTPSGAQMLANHLWVMPPQLLEQLDKWRSAGKDHLCVVPHGPFHYAPFHLFGEVDEPLAANWVVSYLPNVQLLTAGRGTPSAVRRRDRLVASLGMTYRDHNPYGLPSLPRAAHEAATVAALYDQAPILDDEVTEWTVRQALGDSLYVHLAAHGRMDVDAPAFQCLYLTPDERSDGRLSAHELLDMNLRGTQVLTLSACETALGRFDYADNLRGLPASFLLGGVSTVIGTLWPVEDAASACFFSAFYRELRDNSPRLDAFATAQRLTRERFPAYRAWGPFCYVGEWD